MGIVWDSYGGMEMAARDTQASVGFVVETKETGRDMHLVALGCHALLKSASHSFANFNSLDRCFIGRSGSSSVENHQKALGQVVHLPRDVNAAQASPSCLISDSDGPCGHWTCSMAVV